MAFLLVAKPFVAFNMYKRVLNSGSQTSHFLLLRLIKKRKEGEYIEDAVAEINFIQQKISAPIVRLLLRYASFIAYILGANFQSFIQNSRINLINTYFKIVPASQYSLFVGKLSI